MFDIIAAGQNTYDNCHVDARRRKEGVIWLFLRGHYRSFDMKWRNFGDFIAGGGEGNKPCVVVVLYTMETPEATGGAWWGNRVKAAGAKFNATNVTARVAELAFGGGSESRRLAAEEQQTTSAPGKTEKTTSGKTKTSPADAPSATQSKTDPSHWERTSLLKKNFAYAIERRAKDNNVLMMGTMPVVLLELCRILWGIPAGGSDHEPLQHIYIFSRPDILFSHTLDFSRLFSLDREYVHTGRSWSILTPHAAGMVSGWDPSELFMVFSRAHLLRFSLRQIQFVAPLRLLPTPSGMKNMPGTPYGCCVNFEDQKHPDGDPKVWNSGGGDDPFTKDSKNQPQNVPLERAQRVKCGHGWPNLVIHAPANESDVFFIGIELKIHVLRMGGDRETAVNSPGSPAAVIPHQPLVYSMGPLAGQPKILDITRNGWSVLGGRNCRKSGAEQQKRWYWEGGRKYGFMYLVENSFVYMSRDKLDDFVAYGKQKNEAWERHWDDEEEEVEQGGGAASPWGVGFDEEGVT